MDLKWNTYHKLYIIWDNRNISEETWNEYISIEWTLMCVKHEKKNENFTWKITAGCFLNEIFTQKIN